jgi:hypothetical protein
MHHRQMPMHKHNLDDIILPLRKRIERTLPVDADLHQDLDMLLGRAVDDPPMALVRARRMLEVLVYDFCGKQSPSISILNKYGRPELSSAIRNLEKTTHITRASIALCDAIRLEGNWCVHYDPKVPEGRKSITVDEPTLIETLHRLAEVVEVLLSGDGQGFALGLQEPFRAMHSALRTRWVPQLNGKTEGVFPLSEALELIYRSTVRYLTPELLTVLEKYESRGDLPGALPPEEMVGLRQLRGLGLIEHDGQWLFAPTRSTRIDLTPGGRLLLALKGDQPSDREEQLVREVIRHWQSVEEDSAALKLLKRIRHNKKVAPADKTSARRLRNMYLLRHSSELLASAEEVSLTDLGYYILGRNIPD